MTDIPADALRETWDSVYNKTLQLAAMIETDCRQRGEQFDAIVVVPRGSYYPVNILARELGFGAVDLLHASIGSYADATTDRRSEFQLGQMPSDKQIAGKNLLIIEEICDSGRTLKFLTDRLREQGAGLIRTGVLHYKPAQSQTSFVPDWFVAKTDKWIVYPWELHEAKGLNSQVKRRG